MNKGEVKSVFQIKVHKETDNVVIYFERKQLIHALLIGMGVVIIFHLLSVLIGEGSWQIERLFNLELESNIPNWFRSLIFAFSALIAYGCARLSSVVRERRFWIFATVGLLLCSADDMVMIHENIFELLKKYFSFSPLISKLEVSWPITIGPFVALAAIWFAFYSYQCLKNYKFVFKLMTIGISLFLLGEVLIEFLTNFVGHDHSNWLFQLRLIVEEGLQFIGLIIFLSGLLHHQQLLHRQLEQRNSNTQSLEESERLECRV